MKREVITAIQVAVFLFGVAWLDRAFEGYHVPPLVAEYHKQPGDAPSMDDGHHPPANLTVPQASMPIPHRRVQAWPQEEVYFHPPRRPTLVAILTQYGTTV